MIKIPPMNTPTLPPEITMVRDSMSVTRYVLPKRNLGAARKVGWAPLGFGVFITVFMLFWMGGPIASGLQNPGAIKWLGIGFGLLGLPGLVVGLGMIAVGIVILTNSSHSEIIIGDGLIWSIERIGPFPISRKRFITGPRWLVVRQGGMTVRDNNGGSKTYAPELASIEAELITGKPLWMVPGYPHELLRPLADVLAASLSLGGNPSGTETGAFSGSACYGMGS
jgi:hypothetical protein